MASVKTDQTPIDELLTKEWLLTNSRGGYASSTIAACNTRRYHGLLTGSLQPPVNRIMSLSNCLELVVGKSEVYNLSTFEFGDKFAPKGFGHIKQFRRDTGVHFDYQLDAFELTKSIYLLPHTDTVAVAYDFIGIAEAADFILRPFVGLRDFHSLQNSHAPLSAKWLGDGLAVHYDIPGSCELFLSCPDANYESDPQWWFNFVYRTDKERGQDFTEDLWTPGFFKTHIDAPTKIVFWANLINRCGPENHAHLINSDIKKVCKDLQKYRGSLIASAKTKDETLSKLSLAADQFIANRSPAPAAENTPDKKSRTTILAGYPWFADWGRDTFISLPGLLLSTGRYDQARSVLTTFAHAADKGMVPNRFDDYSDTAHFNSIDASLWFVNAAFQYLKTSGDHETFDNQLLPTIKSIIDSYDRGTRFDIHADTDGLITAGNKDTQLTWMDAMCDGIAFTPRYGKAVEINALWYNSLCLLAEYYADHDTEVAEQLHAMADKVEASFKTLFWNHGTNCLNDCIFPDGTADASIRPNQIFAVSLGFSPLSSSQRKSVVEAVQEHLLTPYGLRTLSPKNKSYRGSCTGPQRQRDSAYHQGTVWPWLMGAFIESYLKVNDFSRQSRKKSSNFIAPLIEHFTQDACIGSISEIFDGDPPHKPRGCIAQAWSVAELLRSYRLINS